MIEPLGRHRRIAIDTAPLIYFLEGAGRRAAPVRELLRSARLGQHELVVSAVTEAELLVAPLRSGDPSALEVLRALLDGSENLAVIEVGRPIARAAARLRANHGLRLADAIVAATALESRCTALLSNDAHFARLDGVLEYVHVDALSADE